jgi:uncharacterized membrane protein
MNFSQFLSVAHIVTAILLFSLAIGSIALSVLIAIKPAAQSTGQGLVKRARVVALIEILTVGAVTLTGVVAAVLASLPLSQTWLWMGLVIMVFYGTAHQLVTKPARMNVPEGGTAVKVGMQVALQVAHVLLLIVAFAIMRMRPL